MENYFQELSFQGENYQWGLLGNKFSFLAIDCIKKKKMFSVIDGSAININVQGAKYKVTVKLL